VSRAEAAPFPGAGAGSERRLRAFRALDAFALEAYQAARLVRQGDGEALAAEIGRAVARAGGAFVAACVHDAGSAAERDALAAARARLVEGRYPVYLARRLGLFDVRRYRSIAARHDAALREIDALLRPP
jgi:hypothetical protein